MSEEHSPAQDFSTRRFDEARKRATANAPAFWAVMARAIDWFVQPQSAFDDKRGWFADGTMNTCYNCLDRHVSAGRGTSTALIYDSPVTDTITRYSFAELLEETGRVAAMLKSLGLEKGDRVVIYMPMIPETVFAMLACARLGAIHSVVFGGFAPPELAKRIDDATPKIVLTASCGIEGGRIIAYKPLMDEALMLSSHQVKNVVLLQRKQVIATANPQRDIDWMNLHARTSEEEIPPCAAVTATDPLYILYTSGTTGNPKGVVRENGGHAVALTWSMKNIYGIDAGDTFWAASDVGWVVGHSYIVYGPLLVGATTVLFGG